MRGSLRALIIASSIGVGIVYLKKLSNITFEFSISSSDIYPHDDDEMLIDMFDCPECGLPAEIAGLALEMQPDGSGLPCYLVNCFGDHELIAVTPKWLEENALEQS